MIIYVFVPLDITASLAAHEAITIYNSRIASGILIHTELLKHRNRSMAVLCTVIYISYFCGLKNKRLCRVAYLDAM